MELVLFCHPSFLASQSMPRFAQMLKSAYEARGHHVRVWSPQPKVFNWVPRGRWSKWAGYIDQYLLFPFYVRRELRRTSRDTLFVFCDQALGPWVPLVKDRPHVVHAHDLLALRSALGDIPENPTGLTGRIYQSYIRRGFRHGRHFISVSNKTRDDLQRFGRVRALTSHVVYNGMNYPYAEMPPLEAHSILQAAGLAVPAQGIILHVGGGQWYKNQPGVLALYAEYAARTPTPLPLWCVGREPSAALLAAAKIPGAGTVVFVRNADNAALQALYSCAHALLQPSLAEGFGWPLIEAQACGCPVITTNEAPMTEVAGESAVYLPRLNSPSELKSWAEHGASALESLLAEDSAARVQRKMRGQQWISRFNPDKTIDRYLAIYQLVLEAALVRDAAGSGQNQGVQT